MKTIANKKGFTLIELLIVVAIIAILAAIAVPNFLEAQTRSKVSRAKADLRSLALALEAYHIDFPIYPFPTSRGIGLAWTVTRDQEIKSLRAGSSSYPYGVPPDELTTPVAYMSTIPNDFFKVAGFGVTNPNDIILPADHPWHRYSYGNRLCTPSFYDDSNWGPTLMRRPEWHGKQWIMTSYGPDRTEDVYSPWTMTEYDPTNGTVSKGDITRSGP